MPRKDSLPASASNAQAQQEAISDGIENYELPKTLVTRIAKSSIPEQAKLQKETVTALVKGSTVFINYLAATAHDVASSRQHKTISASDVLKALEMIQFGDMVDPLNQELQVFRENTKSAKKGSKAGGAANGAASGTSGGVTGRAKQTAKGKGRVGPSPLSASVSASGAHGDDATMDDVQGAEGGDEAEEGDDDEAGEGEEEDELVEDVDFDDDAAAEEEEGEGEEAEDRMAVEEDELRQDRKRDTSRDDD